MSVSVLSFKQVFNLIKAVGPTRTVVVEGEHGIGKTALYHAICADPQFQDHIRAGIIDCAQLSDGALFMYDIDREKGVSRELPNERFGITHDNQKGINGARPVIQFFDEIGKAPTYVKNQIAAPLYERRMGVMHYPDGSVVFAATNLGVEGLGDSLAPHMMDRIVRVQMRKPTQKEWLDNFGLPRGLNAAVLALTDQYPQLFDSFVDYEPGGKYADQTMIKHNARIFNPRAVQGKWATPRSLHAASDIVDQFDRGLFDEDTLTAALTGTVGQVVTADLMSMVRYKSSLVKYEDVIADPEHAKLSDNPNAQLVQVFQFVTNVADRTEAEALTTYVERMRGEFQLLFCNQVSESSKARHFVTIARFASLMRKHAVKFG